MRDSVQYRSSVRSKQVEDVQKGTALAHFLKLANGNTEPYLVISYPRLFSEEMLNLQVHTGKSMKLDSVPVASGDSPNRRVVWSTSLHARVVWRPRESLISFCSCPNVPTQGRNEHPFAVLKLALLSARISTRCQGEQREISATQYSIHYESHSRLPASKHGTES